MDKQQQHLKSFEKFYFLFSKELDDDLKKVENIEDSVKKYREVFRMVSKYKLQESNMSEHYSAAVNLGSIDDKYFSAFQGYSKKVHQLEKIKSELEKKDEVKKKIEEWKNNGK